MENMHRGGKKHVVVCPGHSHAKLPGDLPDDDFGGTFDRYIVALAASAKTFCCNGQSVTVTTFDGVRFDYMGGCEPLQQNVLL